MVFGLLWVIGLIVVGILDVWLLAAEVFGWSFLVFALFVAGAWYLVPAFTNWIVSVGWWHLLAIYTPIYLVSGIGVAYLKWLQFVGRHGEPIAEHNKKFTKFYKPEWFDAYTKHWNAPRPTAEAIEESKRKYDEFIKAEEVKRREAQRQGEPYRREAEPRVLEDMPPRDSQTVNEVAFRRAFFLWTLRHGLSIPQMSIPPIERIQQSDFSPTEVNHLADERAFLEEITPKAIHNKTKITAWIFEWPFVVVATLFRDVILEFGKWVTKAFDNWLGGVSRAIIGRATKGI